MLGANLGLLLYGEVSVMDRKFLLMMTVLDIDFLLTIICKFQRATLPSFNRIQLQMTKW